MNRAWIIIAALMNSHTQSRTREEEYCTLQRTYISPYHISREGISLKEGYSSKEGGMSLEEYEIRQIFSKLELHCGVAFFHQSRIYL